MTRTGHPDLASAFADHARRKMTRDVLNVRPWPNWEVPGETAECCECPVCNSTLILVTPITGQRAANHDGYEIGGEA